MATCPRCKGHLNDGHRCPRRRIWVVAEIIACGFAGGLAGLLLLARFDPQSQAADMDGTAIVVGAVVAIAIDRIIRS
jgi:hypothetical protein